MSPAIVRRLESRAKNRLLHNYREPWEREILVSRHRTVCTIRSRSAAMIAAQFVNHLAVVNKVPFRPPNVENATATGMNQVATVLNES